MEEKIISTLEEIGKKLNEEYLKAGTKSKKKKLIYELFSFSVLCEEEFGLENKHLWVIDDSLLLDRDYFLDIINRDKKIFFDISKTVIDKFIEIRYPFYANYNKTLPRMSISQMRDIVFAFLDDFDKDTSSKLKNKIKNNKVFITSLSESEGGYINPFEFLNDGIIVMNSGEGYDLEFAKNLVHECGHLFELEHLYSQNRKMYRISTMSTPYYEVSSSFFEYAFLRYIKDNRLLNHSIDIVLNNYFMELFINSFGVNIACMKKKLDTSDGTIYIDEENIKKHANSIMNKSNYYGPLYYKDGIDSRFPFIYFIGQLMSLYMYENYKENKEKFKKEFKKSFLLYPSDPSLEVFSEIGVDQQELKEGKILKKVLKEYNSSLN